MPDLKSELMKLSNLSFDDPGEPDMQPTTTPTHSDRKISLSERVWYILLDNPASSVRRLSELAGITNPEAANIANKFYVRQLATRQMKEGVWAYTTCVAAYPIIDRNAAIQRALAGRKQRLDSAKTKRKYERKVAPEPVKVQVSTPKDQSVDEMLNTMPIAKARALYDALKKIFGG